MKFLSALALLLLSACSSASVNITDKITIFSNEFEITSEDNKCYLIQGSSKNILAPKPPCHFVRNSDKTPQYFSYNDIKMDAVLIISGTPISKKIRKEWGLPDNLICGSEAQGVLIQNKLITITKKVISGGVLCRDKGSDEKNYWHFSH